MKSVTRQQLFARLCSHTDGRLPLIHDPGFALFLESKIGADLIENVIDLALKRYFGVRSKAEIPTNKLAKFIGDYDEWRIENL